MANKYVKSFNFGGDTLYPLPIVTTEQNGLVLKVVDGSWVASELVSVKLIKFTIVGITYQAKEGMTWAEWVESEYNTDDFTASSSTIFKTDTSIVKYNSINVTPTDVIISDATYTANRPSPII